MSWENLIRSEVFQKLGVSVIFIGMTWLFWLQMNVHIDGRFSSQDARIEDMRQETVFMREYIEEAQEHRRTFFEVMGRHLQELSRRRPSSGARE